jgi:hypothetical protein
MTVKLSGAEFRRFFDDPAVWGRETYYEDAVLRVNGRDVDSWPDFDHQKVADCDVVTFQGGFLANAPQGVPEALEACVRWWVRRQNLRQLVIEVPAHKLPAVREALAALGITLGAHATLAPCARKAPSGADDATAR